MLSTSVLISTYNGEKYIMEQLDSIRIQSVAVDEVIIRDDASNDHTPQIIEEYINNHNLEHWYLIRNSKNIGWKKNFRNGMDDCTKDIVFLCDQDDIWRVDKVKDMVHAFKENTKINVLVSDYYLKYENSVSKSRYDIYQQEMDNTGKIEQIQFTSRWPYVNRPGCTFGVRRSFYLTIKDLWDVNVAHDGIFWRYSIASDSLYRLHKNEIEYRRHGRNVTGTRDFSISNRINEINLYITFFEELLSYCKSRNDNKKINIISNGLKWLILRKSMFENKKCYVWFLLAFCYSDYYSSVKGLLADALYYFRAKR